RRRWSAGDRSTVVRNGLDRTAVRPRPGLDSSWEVRRDAAARANRDADEDDFAALTPPPRSRPGAGTPWPAPRWSRPPAPGVRPRRPGRRPPDAGPVRPARRIPSRPGPR